jgi:formylglycine-generating enzyme required for sulfatase activity/predicted nucleic acid-binding protein
MTLPPDSGTRLERALEVYLAAPTNTPAEAAHLLDLHPELRDLLEPMLGTRDTGHDAGEEQVLGDFRLLRELGRGGMGIVYEAWQRSLDRRVAVKVLAPALVASPGAVARLRREAAAAGRLRHPNLVEVYGFGSDSGQHFFAMQIVDGESLHACRQRFQQPDQAISLIAQLVAALAHAHTRGLVHRDVKPANILVHHDGRPMLTDFGVASDEALPSLTREGAFLGTLDYASPEQVRGEPVDARTDVWASGVVLYELVRGVHPFAGPTQEATLRNILTAEPAPLHKVRGISNDLAAVVGRALEKDRTRRYASASALHADLIALQQSAPVSARLPTTAERLWRWGRREPWQATALAVLLLGTVAAASGFLLANRRADENAALAMANGQLAHAEGESRRLLGDKVRDFTQLAGIVIYERTLQREATLYPAWPQQAAALRSWLGTDCHKLEQLHPQIEGGVQSLRERARPPTDAEVEQDRRASPQFVPWQAANRQFVSLGYAAAIRAGTQPLVPAMLPEATAALPATALNQLAWERVAPKPAERLVHGEESFALACARLAAQKAAGGPLEHQVLDTLAWTLLANGQDAEAELTSAAALASCPAAAAAEYETYQRDLAAAIAARPARLAALAHELQTLAPDVLARRTFRFDDEADQFLHDALVELLGKLDRLFADTRPRVAERLAWAQRIGALTQHHPGARVTWEAARAAIAAADDVVASNRYRGTSIALDLDQFMGLVPIGMNPVTKLWEFYDLRSAFDGSSDPATIVIPQHDAEGRIAVGDDTGIVFVLLPGGSAAIGSQDTDPDGPNYDPGAVSFTTPVQQVELAPFLLARHELTQGQWARLCTGDETQRHPSGLPIGADDHLGGQVTAAHPVARVSWAAAIGTLHQHGLVLPTEAQWEYGCRAGSWTPWSAGPHSEDLRVTANVADARLAQQSFGRGSYEPWDDGHYITAPVGSFAANAFGLFDMHGNVGEWCQDAPSPNSNGFRPGDGARRTTLLPNDRSSRGGSYQQVAAYARSSLWVFGPRETRAVDLGLRPARLLRRP